MKLTFHPLRSIRRNFQTIGDAVNASRQYTRSSDAAPSSPEAIAKCDAPGIHF